MRKTSTKLFVITSIFVIAYIIGVMLYRYFSVIWIAYFRYAILIIALSISVTLVIVKGENYGKDLIAIYGGSLIPAGAFGGMFLCASFFAILGETENDLFIFERLIFPVFIFTIFFVAIGLVLVSYQLKKDAIIPLIPFVVGMIAMAFFLWLLYIQATKNLLTESILMMHLDLIKIRDITMISSLLSWGLIIYRVKLRSSNQS